jgi:hypothetical protein
MPKTSDFAGNKKRPEWSSLTRLAEFQGRTERTIREWCKKGLIPEAYQTRGGHWRIRMPLSWKTRAWLHRRSKDWPFQKNAGDWQGDFTAEFAEWLMLAELYQSRLDEDVPVPTIAELGDPIWEGIEESTDPRAKQARKIQDEIMRRVQNNQSMSDLLTKGWVFQFWLKNQRLPNIADVGELMRLSRPTLYRRGYNARKRNEDYLIAAGELKRDLLGPDGLDPVQRQNLEAKKPGFESMQHDPFANP